MESGENKFMDAEAARSMLPPERVRLEIVDETGSTNDDLKALVRSGGATAPVVRFAFSQTGGRGTRGRRWINPVPAFLFSVLVPAPGEPNLVPLKTGLSIVGTLSRHGVEAGLKWPNDVWAGGGKAGGILCEGLHDPAGRPWIVIGAGLNLLSFEGRTERGWPVGGLFPEGALPAPRECASLFTDIVLGLLDSFVDGNAPSLNAWREHDVFYGQRVKIAMENGALTGVERGITDDGRLLVLTNDGLTAIMSGTILKG